MYIPPKIAQEFLEICHRLYAKGFVAATDGNVSVRLENGSILSTPTGKNKGDLTSKDLVLMTAEGKPLPGMGRPSTEILLHLEYYKERKDVNSVVHAHPPYCTGFATAGEGLAGCVLPEIVVSLGSVPLAPYATPSTDEVPESIRPFVREHDVILLKNHGVVAAGASLRNAYYSLEKAEHAAHILFIAKMLGGEQRLTSSQVEKLKTIAKESYGVNVTSTPLCVPAFEGMHKPTLTAPKTSLEIKDSILRAINELGL